MKNKNKTVLEFEQHNFRIDSTNWEKIRVGGEEYLESPEGDVWEFVSGECKGEQLFTWHAAMRETKKAGKRMPTDSEFSKLLKTKSDMQNLVLAGYRDTGGSFYDRTTYADFWSSSQYDASYSWRRELNSGYAAVYRYVNSKANGFSVRCLKDRPR